MFDIGNAFLNIRYAIYGLIRAALASVLDLFGSMTDGLINASLRTENALQTGAISTDMIERIYYYIYGAAVTLVVLKFLWKGVQIYILWRDGDSENSPPEHDYRRLYVTGSLSGISRPVQHCR